MSPQGVNLTDTSPLLLPKEENGRPVEAIQAVKEPIYYCLYARKSSEDDERQALSIDSQIKEMTSQAETQGIQIKEIRHESHSAKNSGQRPVFNGLIADIRSGVFEGILSWAPDRLSRNAGDLGSLVDLMDSGYLKEIRTNGQSFTNSPNDKFLLMILCSQAKLENDHRGENVKRGMKTKCEMGYRPHLTPMGYLNDKFNLKGQKKIYIDPERAPIIKEAFEKVAYHGFSGRRIYVWFRDEKDFRTRSGKPITLSAVYRMFGNPYYTGTFEFPTGSGKWYKGAYEPIVSKELFKKVQLEMAVPPKTKPGTKEFAFTKMIKCGSCGSGITAQDKFKKCKNGRKRYIYYHCSKSRDLQCPEPYIREEVLIEEFSRLLEQVPPETIKDKTSLGEKLQIFERFIATGLDNGEAKSGLQNFIKHILQEGTRQEKRELIGCLNTTLYLSDRKITIG